MAVGQDLDRFQEAAFYMLALGPHFCTSHSATHLNTAAVEDSNSQACYYYGLMPYTLCGDNKYNALTYAL